MNHMEGAFSGGEPAGRLEETKRLARILRILTWLSQQPGRWTRQDLVQRLEVSERQIDKDLELIRHGLGYRIRRTRTGYCIDRAPELPPVQFTATEALALVTALHLARDGGAADQTALVAAIARMEGALPAPLAHLARDLKRPAELSPQHRHRAAMVASVQSALAERRVLRVVYESASRGGERSERALHPYHLEIRGQSWVLIAHDSLRGVVRDFVVDRLVSAVPSEERYSIPPDFDPGTYRGGGWGLLRDASGPPERIVLRFTPEEARRVHKHRTP